MVPFWSIKKKAFLIPPFKNDQVVENPFSIKEVGKNTISDIPVGIRRLK
jgi:hypothetical protein